MDTCTAHDGAVVVFEPNYRRGKTDCPLCALTAEHETLVEERDALQADKDGFEERLDESVLEVEALTEERDDLLAALRDAEAMARGEGA